MTEDAYESIAVERLDRVRRITINRPDKKNAMDLRCQEELVDAITIAGADEATHAVILRGAGTSFSTGYDLGRSNHRAPRPSQASKVRRDLDSLLATVDRWTSIWHCPIPVIAQVHGHCLAGGAELALHCDMLIVAEDAVLGFPPVRSLGVPPTHMWTYHVGPQWTKRLLFTGDTITGRRAVEIGLALCSVPAAALDDEALALATRIGAVSRESLIGNKYIANEAIELMGRSRLQSLSAAHGAIGHLAPDAVAFAAAARTDGLRSALAQRDAPFAQGEPL